MRGWIACCLMVAVFAVYALPANGENAYQTPEALQALAIMDHSCSSDSDAKDRLPDIKQLLSKAGRRSVYLSKQVAQVETSASPAPAPTATPAVPGATPTPFNQQPPIGPGVIPPPTTPPATTAPA